MLRGVPCKVTGWWDSDLDWGWGASGKVLAVLWELAGAVRASANVKMTVNFSTRGFCFEILTIVTMLNEARERHR